MNVAGGMGCQCGDLPVFISALRADSIAAKNGKIQVCVCVCGGGGGCMCACMCVKERVGKKRGHEMREEEGEFGGRTLCGVDRLTCT